MKKIVHTLVVLAVILYAVSWLFTDDPTPLPEMPPHLGG